jgi:chromosome partitioning protein
MRIISVANQKGGCGKTTTAVNLSASLAQNSRRVLLLDLDPQAHATLGLNIKSDLSIYNVLSKLANHKARLQDILQKVGPNFDMAPSSLVLSTLEQEMAGEIGRESRLFDILQNFSGSYDYCIIDCPPNLGILTVNAIRASEEIIVPVEASRFSLEGLSLLISIINLVNERLNHKVSYRVLVTNFDSRLRHSFAMLEWIQKSFKNTLFSTIVHVNVKLNESQNQGTHVFNYDKYCRGAKDYYSLAREIITIDAGGMVTPPAVTTHEIPSFDEISTVKKTPAAPASRIAQAIKEIEESEHDPVTVTTTATSRDKHASMEKKMDSLLKEELPRMKEITFTFDAPQAKEIYVAGEFNGWRLDETSRMVNDNGVWKKNVELPQGSYRYRFVVDGTWIEDTQNPLRAMNPYGTMDSLLEISS